MKEKTIEEIKNWLQLRIDYWEKAVATLDKIPEKEGHYCRNQAFEEGEAEGMTQAFYEVMEFIDGQRK